MSTAPRESGGVNKVLIFWMAVMFLFLGCTVFWMAGLPAKVASWMGVAADSTDIIGTSGSSVAIKYDHGAWKDESWLKEFTLTERSGKLFHSRDLEGKVWVASFFFASCPTICLRQNEEIKQLHEQLGPRGVSFVSITCDPVRDTPSALRAYADRFGADSQSWLFLTGEMLHIRRVGGEFFLLSVDKETHSSHLAVVDKWGTVRGRFDWKNPQQMAEMNQIIDRLLTETEPPVEREAEADSAEEAS